ncbi:tyrosine-type recombinase/integrase [Mycobacterium paraintracellulare]|uniref:tyrosine-type recombinase/integrase n=1 Tax=Mycobacterium paraintracellulare TaxID=1138383 RepID=UPI001927B42C|nr:tyrosine-type recombinase/integrase [Mycobacterium paraintracellulare]
MTSRARNARARAKRLGLRLSQHGTVFSLSDDQGATLEVGPLSAVEAYLGQRYTARRPGPQRTTSAPPAWVPLIEDYLVTLVAAGQPSTTVKLRCTQLVRMARDLGGRPADVTGETLVAWFGHQRQWSVETRRSYRAAVRGFFAWAYKVRRVPTYLADELPRVRQLKPSPRPAPDHAWRAALESADARVTLMLRLAGEAGCRRGEVARVHTRDLADGATGWSLRINGKGGKQRVVPISDTLAEQIRRGAAGHTPGAPAEGWLFPAAIPSRHLTPGMVGELVARALPDHWTMHTLRHRFATRAYRGTRNLRAVQTLLGHSSIATTERYTAVDDDEIRAAMEAAGA